jgi:hypothetical protein
VPIRRFFFVRFNKDKKMKKFLITLSTASLLLLIGTGSSVAQDDGMLVIPVEMYACSYNNRKDADDLDDVVDKWNAYMDANGIDSYAAWTLTPDYYGPNQEFDVIWMGAAKNAIAMGEGHDAWLTDNDGIAADFQDVMTCNGHSNFASINHKALPDGGATTTAVLTFSDCSYKEGATFAAVSTAAAKWSQYQTDAGSTAGIFHWYPVWGGGGEEFTFKWIEGYANHAELGADYERYGNGRGFETRGNLFRHLLSCDSARVYNARSRRSAQLR